MSNDKPQTATERCGFEGCEYPTDRQRHFCTLTRSGYPSHEPVHRCHPWSPAPEPAKAECACHEFWPGQGHPPDCPTQRNKPAPEPAKVEGTFGPCDGCQSALAQCDAVSEATSGRGRCCDRCAHPYVKAEPAAAEGLDDDPVSLRRKNDLLQAAIATLREPKLWKQRAEAASEPAAEGRDDDPASLRRKNNLLCETVKVLNRRAQLAEAAVLEKIQTHPDGSLGRTLANAAAEHWKREAASLREQLAAKERDAALSRAAWHAITEVQREALDGDERHIGTLEARVTELQNANTRAMERRRAILEGEQQARIAAQEQADAATERARKAEEACAKCPVCADLPSDDDLNAIVQEYKTDEE